MVATGVSAYFTSRSLFRNSLLRESWQGIKLAQNGDNGSARSIFGHKSGWNISDTGCDFEARIFQGLLQQT